jgi:hypothetical protein
MSPNRHNISRSMPASLPEFILIIIAFYLAAQGTPDDGHDFLQRVHDWLETFGDGHILPLYADNGHCGHKQKQD